MEDILVGIGVGEGKESMVVGNFPHKEVEDKG